VTPKHVVSLRHVYARRTQPQYFMINPIQITRQRQNRFHMLFPRDVSRCAARAGVFTRPRPICTVLPWPRL